MVVLPITQDHTSFGGMEDGVGLVVGGRLASLCSGTHSLWDFVYCALGKRKITSDFRERLTHPIGFFIKGLRFFFCLSVCLSLSLSLSLSPPPSNLTLFISQT